MGISILATTLNPKQHPIIVGVDTGGTNTRLKGYEVSSRGLEPVFTHRVRTADYRDYAEMIVAQLVVVGGDSKGDFFSRTIAVGSGIAGEFLPDVGKYGAIHMENCPEMDIIDLGQVGNKLSGYGIPAFAELNDFEALAWALMSSNNQNQREVINQGQRREHPPELILLLGDGTGLGAGIGINQAGVGKEVRVVKLKEAIHSEGGHIGLPHVVDWSHEENGRFLDFLELRNKAADPDGNGWLPEPEDVISGRGLINVYLFVAGLNELPAELQKAESPAAMIVQRALDEDGDCRKAMGVYAQFYGYAARNLALAVANPDSFFLTNNAWNERPFLKSDGLVGDAFMRGFIAKARLHQSLKTTPIDVIDPSGLAELGTAHFLEVLLNSAGVFDNPS